MSGELEPEGRTGSCQVSMRRYGSLLLHSLPSYCSLSRPRTHTNNVHINQKRAVANCSHFFCTSAVGTLDLMKKKEGRKKQVFLKSKFAWPCFKVTSFVHVPLKDELSASASLWTLVEWCKVDKCLPVLPIVFVFLALCSSRCRLVSSER